MGKKFRTENWTTNWTDKLKETLDEHLEGKGEDVWEKRGNVGIAQSEICD